MIEIIVTLAAIAVTFGVCAVGHKYSRDLFGRKLRYVPAAQTSKAPIIAGVGAALLTIPLAGILPLVGLGTALCFGISVGMGAAAGTRDVKGRLGGF